MSKNLTDQEIQTLREKAIEASTYAHAPYSKYRVGAALLSTSGKIFTGCNVENSSFGATVCAERVALFKAISENEKAFEAIYLYTDEGWPPCGMCRQVMSEFCDYSFKVIIGDKNTHIKTCKLEELFPLAFDSNKLDIK